MNLTVDAAIMDHLWLGSFVQHPFLVNCLMSEQKTAEKNHLKTSQTKHFIQFDLKSCHFYPMSATVGDLFVALAATFGCYLTQTYCCCKLKATSNSLLSCNMIRFQEEFDKYLWVQHNSFANQIERLVAHSPNSIHVCCC